MVDISIAELPARADHHDFNTPIRRKMRKMLDIVGWTVVLLLLFVGLSSLVSRVVLLNSEFSKEVVNIGNGVSNFDIRYIQHYFVAGVHLLFGFIVYVFAPFQFMTSIRKRFIGPYTLFCLYKAYSNIRARNFGEHREWMIRTFALMLGVATQRVLMIILTVLTGIGREPMFAPAMIAGMIINIVVAEYWIALTKTPGSGHRHWKDLDRRTAS